MNLFQKQPMPGALNINVGNRMLGDMRAYLLIRSHYSVILTPFDFSTCI